MNALLQTEFLEFTINSPSLNRIVVVQISNQCYNAGKT